MIHQLMSITLTALFIWLHPLRLDFLWVWIENIKKMIFKSEIVFQMLVSFVVIHITPWIRFSLNQICRSRFNLLVKGIRQEIIFRVHKGSFFVFVRVLCNTHSVLKLEMWSNRFIFDKCTFTMKYCVLLPFLLVSIWMIWIELVMAFRHIMDMLNHF